MQVGDSIELYRSGKKHSKRLTIIKGAYFASEAYFILDKEVTLVGRMIIKKWKNI